MRQENPHIFAPPVPLVEEHSRPQLWTKVPPASSKVVFLLFSYAGLPVVEGLVADLVWASPTWEGSVETPDQAQVLV